MKQLILAAVVMAIGASSASAANIALGKPVTASAPMPTFTYACPAVGGPQPPLSVITDGLFEPRFECYQDGPYWYEGFTPGLTIDIDLQGTFFINRAVAQVDNNDTFMLQYRDVGGIYHDWWLIQGPLTFGFETRPNVLDNTEFQPLPGVFATGLRIFGVVNGNPETDNVWSVAEIQVAPEPATMVLTAGGLLGVLYRRSRQRRTRA
jgi:hypothetical protein